MRSITSSMTMRSRSTGCRRAKPSSRSSRTTCDGVRAWCPIGISRSGIRSSAVAASPGFLGGQCRASCRTSSRPTRSAIRWDGMAGARTPGSRSSGGGSRRTTISWSWRGRMRVCAPMSARTRNQRTASAISPSTRLRGPVPERRSRHATAHARERAVAELTDALAAHAEDLTDLFERQRLAGLKAVIQGQDTAITRRQLFERLPQRLAACALVEARRQSIVIFAGHEIRQRRAAILGAIPRDRLIERALRIRERGQTLHHLDREPAHARDLVDRGLAIQRLTEGGLRLAQTSHVGRAAKWEANRATGRRDRRQDFLLHAQDRIRDKIDADVGIIFVRGAAETRVRLADQVIEGKSAVLIFLCDGERESKIRGDQLFARARAITGRHARIAHATGEFLLGLCGDDGSPTQFLNVQVEDVRSWNIPAGGRLRKVSGRRLGMLHYSRPG